MDDDLGLPDSLVQLSFAVHELLASLAAEFDVTLAQVRLVGILRDREAGMLELARALGLGKSSITGLVDRAERRGLVARARSTDDARGIRVTVTAEGSEAARQFAQRVADGLDELLAPLTARQRAELSKLATRIVTRPPVDPRAGES